MLAEFKQWLDDFKKWMLAGPAEPSSQGFADLATEDWYAGLCVDPHSFSEQLIKLRAALHGTAETVEARESLEE